MKISSQIKLLRDEYAGFYSCGLSMIDSQTMSRLQPTVDTPGLLVMESTDGLCLRVDRNFDEVTGTTRVVTGFTNGSEAPVTLEMIDSFVANDVPGDRIHRFLCSWSAEGRHKVDDVKSLNLEHSWNHMAYRIEKFGSIGSMPLRKYFPLLVVEDSATGTFTAFELYTPSSWQMEIIARFDDRLTITGGIADRDFGHFTATVAPGESFTAPQAVIAQGNSLYDVCDALLRAQHPDISPMDDSMGITFNEYCTSWGNVTEESMLKICDRLAGEGIQYLVMDSGWYIDDGGYWWDNTGNWDYSPKRFPHGLKYTADYIRSKGMIPGIWYEFENVGPLCPLYSKNEWLLSKDSVPLTVGQRRFLDMENPEVIAHLSQKVIQTLKESGFGYIKVDYNDTIGIGCDGPDGLGENLRRKLLATQDFFRKMKREIPELVIENCSSGGHRLEPSMMALSTMASFSDAHEIPSLPIIAANLLLLVRSEQNQIWAVLRATDTDSRLTYSLCATLFGRMGLSGDIYDMNSHQWDLLHQGIAFYRSAAPIIKNGKVTGIVSEPESYNDPVGGQMVLRRHDDLLLVVYHRFRSSRSFLEFAAGADIPDDLKGLICDGQAIAERFGDASEDFSAEARIYRIH